MEEGDATEVPAMQPEDIRRAALSFKKRTACPCGLHPKYIGMVSDSLLQVIARQWTLWERYGQVPVQERQLIVTLINKPDGGLRLIALFRAAYTVLARVKVRRLQDWAAKLDCCAINIVAGRKVSDAFWRAMADRDIEAASQQEAMEAYFCEVQQDVTKAYETRIGNC